VVNDENPITCTIDATAEGLARFRASKTPATDGSPEALARLREQTVKLIGLQRVGTSGVPADSRFALAMVEADYQMKRLALGVDRAAGVTTAAAERAQADGAADKSIYRRWWFTADADGVAANETRDVFRFSLASIKLNAERMTIGADGKLTGNGLAEDAYAKSFNANLAKLEARFSSLADLHNLMDVALAAGLIKHRGAPAWLKSSALLDPKRLPTPRYVAPKQTEPLVQLVGSAGGVTIATGGVDVHPTEAAQAIQAKPSADVKPPSATSASNGWWGDG
jgi:hypothetical protein